MSLRAFIPHQNLRQFVLFYWTLTPEDFPQQHHRLLPGSGSDIIIQSGPPAYYAIGDQAWKLRKPTGFVEGLFHCHFLLRFAPPCRLVGIRFTSTGLYPFVRTAVSEFADQFTDLELVFGKAGGELIRQVAHLASHRHLGRILDRFLLHRLQHVEIDRRITRAAEIIHQNHGATSVYTLGRELLMGERQLERAFDRYVGISPEQFAQHVRVNHFINLAQRPSSPTLTQLAFECGYADQSHLIRAFRRHTGLAPREYFRQRHSIQQTLNSQSFGPGVSELFNSFSRASITL